MTTLQIIMSTTAVILLVVLALTLRSIIKTLHMKRHDNK